MTKFIYKITVFSMIPILLFFIIEVVLPPTLFTFRIWEAVSSASPFRVGPFYPNIKYTMVEQGDLAHHTRYSVEKKVTWETDKLGYRNNSYNPSPDILLIGDSNIAGSSLSQEELIASSLKSNTELSVYNLAPADINTFITLKNEGIFQPPQVAVLFCMERNIPSLPPVNTKPEVVHTEIQFNPIMQFAATQLDKLTRGRSIKYLKARINGATGVGIQSRLDDEMFFLQGNMAVIETSDNVLDPIIERIKSYKDYFTSIGSEFIFLPIPNKQTILWKLTELKRQPDFIIELNYKLKQNGIMTINTVNLFNNLFENGVIPYHSDDTHWNKYANYEVSMAIAHLHVISSKVSYKNKTTTAFQK